jgi:hypothetical protein
MEGRKGTYYIHTFGQSTSVAVKNKGKGYCAAFSSSWPFLLRLHLTFFLWKGRPIIALLWQNLYRKILLSCHLSSPVKQRNWFDCTLYLLFFSFIPSSSSSSSDFLLTSYFPSPFSPNKQKSSTLFCFGGKDFYPFSLFNLVDT